VYVTAGISGRILVFGIWALFVNTLARIL